ncbi:MAG: alpha/beta hydrolase [Desulfuromonadaceae bacterium]
MKSWMIKFVDSLIFSSRGTALKAEAAARRSTGAAVRFVTPSGCNGYGVYWNGKKGSPVVLFFHGSGGHVYDWEGLRESLECSYIHILLVEYPGYGVSEGKASEEGMLDAGRGAMEWLMRDQGIPENQVIVFGYSLGGGIASQIVLEYRVMGLVLLSTFSSMCAAAAHRLAWLPSWLVEYLFQYHSFDTLRRLPDIGVPVLVIHGECDDTIPIVQARTNFEAANHPKELFVVKNADHRYLYFAKVFNQWLAGL